MNPGMRLKFGVRPQTALVNAYWSNNHYLECADDRNLLPACLGFHKSKLKYKDIGVRLIIS